MRGLTLLAAATALWLAGPAAAVDAHATVTDTAGDVTVDPSGPQWRAPDILAGSLSYEGGSDANLGDDLVRGRMTVDASPDAGVQSRVYSGRLLSWWIDTDNNPDTGANRSDLGFGADILVVVFGASNGLPSKAVVKVAQNGQFPRDGRSVPATVSDAGVTWVQTPAELGIQRGRPVRVWFESAQTDASNRTLASDSAPDDKRPSVLMPPFPPPYGEAGAAAVSATAATIGGRVDGRGAPTEWYIAWGRTGGPQAATAPVADDGSASRRFDVPLAGLQPATEYRFQVVVRNAWGETRSAPGVFTTAPATGPTSASVGTGTGAVEPVAPGTSTGESVMLKGSFTPSGARNTWFFEWGTTPAVTRSTTPRARSAGGPAVVSVRLAGLAPGTTYYYRLVGVVDGVRSEGPVQQVATVSVPRLVLAGRVRVACRAGICNITRRTALTVGVRDAAGRPVTGRRALRGLRARVTCLAGCRGRRAVAVRASRGRVLLPLDRVVQRWRLGRGAVVELRVTRSGGTGVAYRVRTLGKKASGTVCRLDLRGRSSCPPVRRRGR